jgi:spore coat protein H
MMVFFRGTSEWVRPRGVKRDARVFTVYDPNVDPLYRERLLERPSQRPTWSTLATRLWDLPETRARLLDLVEAALDGPFSEAKAAAHVDALWAVAGPAILDDPFIARAQAEVAPAHLKTFVRERGAFLRGELPRLRAHGGGPLVVNELGFGGGAFVELHNRGDAAIDLGGLTITDDLRVPGRFALPSGLVVPPRGHLVLVADGSSARGHLPFAPSTSGGELGVFRAGAVSGPLDVVFYGPHAAGRGYGRAPDGAERFREADPTPGSAN